MQHSLLKPLTINYKHAYISLGDVNSVAQETVSANKNWTTDMQQEAKT
jgi:hypothetical protein